MKVDPHSRRVTLPVHMALELASRWHDQLLPCLEPELITLDGGQVQDIDAPAFEALVTLRERIERLGLRSMLLLPIAS